MKPLSRNQAASRCEWGPAAVTTLEPGEVTIVVDVLSFTTCVDIATLRGAAILPYSWNDASAAQFAEERHAELAGRRGETRYSLSPESYLTAAPGLRCVLPSPNGSEITLRAARATTVVLAGCLRNARAVAHVARRYGTTFNVVPAGERWPDGSLRPALEDWLGAGAILRHLPGPRSAEAEAAVTVFERYRETLGYVLANCASGRELAQRGYHNDVALAGQLDVSECAPRFDGEAFVATPPYMRSTRR